MTFSYGTISILIRSISPDMDNVKQRTSIILIEMRGIQCKARVKQNRAAACAATLDDLMGTRGP
jgi:hypothetical protein